MSIGLAQLKKLTMRLPGSTTNLGPGFDTLGLALSVYTTVTFERLEQKRSPGQSLITLKGSAAQSLPANEDNLIYKQFCQNYSGPTDDIALTIETDIPLARGLGSSSTAILAALWAAQAFSSSAAPDREQILASAARIEGHPDNVAACLLGGFIVSGYRQKGNRAICQRLNWPEQWRTLVVVPPYELSTHEARKVLPRRVSMGQAVKNLQRTGLLIAAVVNQDEDTMGEALLDELHEPYRMHLVPELQALRRDLTSLPILGCVLSGAGSSSLVIVHERHHGEIKSYLQTWADKRQHKPQILDLSVDTKGLQAQYE
ncbi:homoserine kinase [bacterium]|nr:homoserine kinase [bacterium]MBP9809749.1 homoserine kinase [bacterium]